MMLVLKEDRNKAQSQDINCYKAKRTHHRLNIKLKMTGKGV
jgi:hypothetical protein